MTQPESEQREPQQYPLPAFLYLGQFSELESAERARNTVFDLLRLNEGGFLRLYLISLRNRWHIAILGEQLEDQFKQKLDEALADGQEVRFPKPSLQKLARDYNYARHFAGLDDH